MHDTIQLEGLGIPAVAVATDVFQTAARAQAGALGRPDFDAVYVAHPIQDQPGEEIGARADGVASVIARRLTGESGAHD